MDEVRQLAFELRPTVLDDIGLVAALHRLVEVISARYGFACLENFDHLNWISETSRDELFDAQVELLILAMGAKP